MEIPVRERRGLNQGYRRRRADRLMPAPSLKTDRRRSNVKLKSRPVAGWGRGRPRQPHKLEIAGPNPAPATIPAGIIDGAGLAALMQAALDAVRPGGWRVDYRRAGKYVITAAAALVLVLLCGMPARAQELAVETNLYAGRLLVIDRYTGLVDKTGAISGGTKLWTVRLTSVVRLKGGLQLGARGDVTALEQLDPTSLDLSSARSLEGYAGLSRPWAVGGGLTIGPALVAGSLVPTGQRGQTTYGAGGRLGLGRSWLYALWGTNGAADAACCHRCCSSDDSPLKRLILAGSIERGRFALAGDLVSGRGGYARLGILVRVPAIGVSR